VTEALQTHELPFTNRMALFFCVIATTLFFVMLAGCGYTGTGTPAIALGGSVHGGHQPVSGATIQVYAAGTSGNSSAAQPLLSDPVKTDSNGNFSIPASYTCPSASSQIYIVAKGGNPGLPSGNNSALMLSAMLGSCGSLSGSGSVSINEVTTVGSVSPLAAYMTDSTHLGSASGDASFTAAVASVPEFINTAQGSSPGTPTAISYFAENAKLYSLADVLSSCVDSAGGAAGDGSPCGVLFSAATPSGGSAPTDTLTAALRIAQNPKNNVGGIYGMLGGNTAFQPTLTAAPADWTLSLSVAIATPTISLPTGTYTGAQQVTLSDSTPGSTIYYTTNGTVPTSSSPSYSGPIAIAATSTVQAIAVLQGSQSTVASSTLTISPTLLQAKLVFLQQPSNAVAQTTISPAVTVAVEDINGNLVPVADDPVQLTLVGGTGLLSGTLVVTPQNGVATFSNLSVDTAGTGYTLVATSPNLPPAISAPFNISAAGSGTPTTPVKLAFVQQPTNAVAGATIAPAVTVVVEDSNGNPVPTATNPVTVAFTTGTGLTGTLTVTSQDGIATFSNLSASTAGTFTLSATSPNLTSAISAGFTISAPGGGTPPPAAKLAFSQQPSNASTGVTISPAVTVVVEDGNGNTVTTATNPVTVALTTGSGLAGTLTATPHNGVATFSNLSLSNAGTYTLSATSPDLVAANSTSFTITSPGGGTPPPAVKLAFSQQPSNASTGATISPAVTVVVQDNNGNTVATATNPVTLALTGTAGLAGTLTVTPQNGVATFSGLSVATAGTYTLSATSPSLTSATSTSFTITAPGGGTPPPAAKLAFSNQPSNASTGATITPAVTVTVEDSNGNPVTTATNPVTIALTTGTGLAGTLTITPQNGIATFSTLSENTAGTYTLSATSPSLTSATSTSFTISTTTTPAGTVATPVLSPAGGSGTQTISMSTSTPGAGIWYTTDGSTPTLPPGGVPQGTSSGYSPMCQPYPMPPLSGLKDITEYGASPSAADNTAAIVNACNAAGAPTSTNGIYIPAGTFNMTSGSASVGTTLNCNIYGQGQSSNLYCPNPTTPNNQLGNSNCQLYSTADNAVWSNFQHSIAASSRDAQNFNIRIVGAKNHRNDTLLLVHGNAGGFFSDGTNGEIDTNNGVIGAYADSNYHTDGATNSTTDHTYVYASGDDSDSNVSYTGESGGLVNGSLVQWNDLTTPTRGRGMVAVGGENMTFQDNLISNMTYAGVYISQENTSSYNISGTSNIIVRYNYVQNSNVPNFDNGQSGIIVYSGNTAGPGVTNVQVMGNDIVQNSATGAFGTGLETANCAGCALSDISFINNTMTGNTGDWSIQGAAGTGVTCSGNTYNGVASALGAPCNGTNPDTATGSPVTYSGCVVGTAIQYTGPITVTSPATIKAVAVFPGLTNSSVGSASYTSGAAAATPTPTF
jgi:hypothetical protein